MEIYVLDNDFKIINTLYTEGGSNPIFDDRFKQYLSNGSSTFDFSIRILDDLGDDLIGGNYLLFYFSGRYIIHQIKTYKDIEGINNVTRNIQSESISLSLYNHHIKPTVIEGTITQALNYVLEGTQWKVGNISPSLSDVIGCLSVDKVTPCYSVLQSLIPEYDNIEYEFRVEPISSVVGKYNFYLDVYADGERGIKTYKRFEHDFNIEDMSRTGDDTNFYTALIGEGANGLTFTNHKWSKDLGDPCDKPVGQDYVIDKEAQAKLGTDKPIIGVYTSTTDSEEQLLLETWRALKQYTQTQFTYDIPITMTSKEYDEIGIGDTVYIVNTKFNPIVQLEARIGELEISFSDPTADNATFTNYKPIKSKIRDVNSNTFVQDAEDAILGHVGKLTQADILKIKQYLSDLGMHQAEIDKLLKKYKDKLPPKVDDTPGTNTGGGSTDGDTIDEEDYKFINIGGKIDNGLWLGDDRLQSIKTNKCAGITSTTNSNNASSASATEYKNALKYYEKFDLGIYGNGTAMSNLRSKSNKYKYYVLVPYWAKKFGLDPQLVYAMIMAESSGNPYCSVGSNAGYGCMQCERSVYFNKKQTITYYDGSTKTFTPSKSTMTPGKGKTTINGVSVDKNISNQIMFGCNEMRKSLKYFKYNIFAALCGYNFGLYGTDWTICRYICDKNGLKFVDKYGYTVQSSKVQSLYFKELEGMKCNWANTRKKFKSEKKLGTPNNIELYLRWYKIDNGQLPYVLVDGKKKGYGANKPSNVSVKDVNTTTKAGVATDVRNKIVAKAREIVDLHVKYKKATYDQKYRIVDDSKRFKAPKTISGISKPYCYDCSSLVSCAYKCVGLTSVYNRSCAAGTLIKNATAKSGYKFWKCTTSNLDNYALPGDIIMVAWKNVPSSPKPSNYDSYGITHHTLIYCGKKDGKHMIAHARGWKRHPNAIVYAPVYSELLSKGIILRPWDLAKLDAEAVNNSSSTATQKVETAEVTIKSKPNAVPQDFYNDKGLVKTLYEEGDTGKVIDNTSYPSTVSHIFLDFNNVNALLESDGNVEYYQGLIKLLLNKYPKKPIFVTIIPHVNNQNSDYVAINKLIDTFNKRMQEFVYKNRYVVLAGRPNAIMDTKNNWIKPELTTGGWKLKDKASADTYYQAYKKHLLWKGNGGDYNSKASTANVTLHRDFTYKFTTPLKSIKFNISKSQDPSFYSRLIFTTCKSSEPTKYTQAENIWLQGKDCKNGQLIPKADTTYTISCYYNPDKDIAPTRYLGSVSGVAKGGKYATFSAFYDREKMVENAKTFYSQMNNFVYNNTTPIDFNEPQDKKSSWTTGEKMHIDDHAFISYVLMGHKFGTSPYGNAKKNDNYKNSKVSWAVGKKSNEANIGKYFVEQGWVFYEADLLTYSNLNKGDIIFMDSAAEANNTDYMGISHTAIICEKDTNGDWISYECVNATPAFRKIKVKSLDSKNILFIGRIRKD